MVVERKPPSTLMSVPVTNEEALRAARNTAAPCSSFSFTEAVHRGMAQDLRGTSRWGAIIVEQQFLVLLGREEAGGDGIDAHTLGGPFTSQEARQGQHRSLSSRVADHARQWQMRGHRSNVDDATDAALNHAHAEDLAGQQGAANQIEVEVGLPASTSMASKG